MKFGIVSDEEYPAVVMKFADDIAADKFVGNKCSTCGNKYFPPRTACEDFHETMEAFTVGQTGVLVAYTIIHFAPDNMSDRAPYVVAIGELEPGVRVLAHITGLMQKPKVGMKLKLKSQMIENDRVTYKWIAI